MLGAERYQLTWDEPADLPSPDDADVDLELEHVLASGEGDISWTQQAFAVVRAGDDVVYQARWTPRGRRPMQVTRPEPGSVAQVSIGSAGSAAHSLRELS